MNPKFMRASVELALAGVKKGHGPFGAVIVRDEKLVGFGSNQVTKNNDPTAHAEVLAIRDACLKLNSFRLTGCEIYTSCEPCPMCLGAIFWARLDKIYYGATKKDAKKIQFDDHQFHNEIRKAKNKRAIPMIKFLRDECLTVFRVWENLHEKVHY